MQTSLFRERILSLLDDLQHATRLSQNLLRKKRTEPEIATALNLADIDLCRELSVSREVAVFVPKDVTYLYLRAGKEYAYAEKNVQSAAANPVVAANDRQISLYLNDESYIDVSAILGSEIFVYPEYPPQAYGTGKRIPVAAEGLQHHADRQAAVIDTDVPALILTRGLAEDGFAVFKAQIMPTFLHIAADFNKQALEAYRIRTPDYAHNVLLRRTLLHLLPGEIELIDQFTRVGLADEQRMHARTPGSGPTAYTPQGAYDFTN